MRRRDGGEGKEQSQEASKALERMRKGRVKTHENRNRESSDPRFEEIPDLTTSYDDRRRSADCRREKAKEEEGKGGGKMVV